MEEVTCIARIAFLAFVLSALISVGKKPYALGENGESTSWADVWAKDQL